MKVTFKFDVETKNKLRFRPTDDAGDVVGSLYINKTAFGGNAPESVTVEVEEL